jgi:hypothetical protein
MVLTVGFQAEYLLGPENWIADDFSHKNKDNVHTYFKGYSPTEVLLLAQAKIDSWKLRLSHFLLTPASVFWLVSVILHPHTVNLPDGKPSKWGQISPSNSIMFLLQEMS